MDHNVFYGPYMRIWLPKIENEEIETICPNETCVKYKKRASSKFCSECGSEIEEIKITEFDEPDLGEFLEEEFNDRDMFIGVSPEELDYVLTLPNNVSRQGGFYYEDGCQTEILTINKDEEDPNWEHFEREDWVKLTELLTKKGIKFEKKVGVLQWLS